MHLSRAGIFTDHCSVSLREGGHGRQVARAQGQSMKYTVMNTHCLVLPKYAVGTQFRQPDVEDVMALCLTGRKYNNAEELKKRGTSRNHWKFSWLQEKNSWLVVYLIWNFKDFVDWMGFLVKLSICCCSVFCVVFILQPSLKSLWTVARRLP